MGEDIVDSKMAPTNFKRLLKEFLELLARFKVGDFNPWLVWINKLNGSDAKVNKAAKAVDVFLRK